MNNLTPRLKELLSKAGCFFVRQGRGAITKSGKAR